MYRQNYSDQPIQQNISTGMSQQIPGYDYRNPNHLYKSSVSMENMVQPILHQSHQMYYDNQTMPPMQPTPYNNMMSIPNMDQGYDPQRYYWRDMEPKHPQSYGSIAPPPPLPMPLPQYSQQQQPHIIQRISSLIKSQLPMLQTIMMQVSSNYTSRVQPHRQYSRSRSRSKQRNRKNSDSSHDWLCRRCSFSNYDWRDTCKKCNQSRPSRSFVPGPEDWKCPKCGNINYARRMECNRCKRPKLSSD